MQSLHINRWLASVLILLGSAMASVVAQEAPETGKARNQQFVDGIAAVVNKQVITLNQVDNEVQATVAQLRQQNIEVPDMQTMRRQVLQRMITEELIRQEADRLNITVNDAQLNQAVESIAQRNDMTVAQLRQEIAKSISWDEYLVNLRDEIRMDQLRQRAVDSAIIISDAEVDAFLKREGRSAGIAALQSPGSPASPAQPAGPRVLGLAQILVVVPENAGAGRVAELRQKAEDILAKLRAGADFAGLAVASSDGPEALEGGEMGVRAEQGWPDLFLQAVRNVDVGDTSGIVQSGNGFHILKVVTRGPQAPAPQATPTQPDVGVSAVPPMPEGPMMVTQTHVRHILIKTTPAMTEERALERLQQLRHRVVMGEDFADLAKRYSEDASAPQGGDLGWVSPGETVPSFEHAMDALEPGQTSEPVYSPFGWHIIQVLERRSKDMEGEYRRMQARQILFQRRVEPAFDDWLSQLHGQAYIDNRIDPEASRRPR